MQVPVELKLKYLNRRFQDIKTLRSSLEQGDFGPALRLGHQVKGNAVTFELPQLAYLGLEIEAEARKGDPARIRVAVEKFELAISKAMQTLKAVSALAG